MEEVKNIFFSVKKLKVALEIINCEYIAQQQIHVYTLSEQLKKLYYKWMFFTPTYSTLLLQSYEHPIGLYGGGRKT